LHLYEVRTGDTPGTRDGNEESAARYGQFEVEFIARGRVFGLKHFTQLSECMH